MKLERENPASMHPRTCFYEWMLEPNMRTIANRLHYDITEIQDIMFNMEFKDLLWNSYPKHYHNHTEQGPFELGNDQIFEGRKVHLNHMLMKEKRFARVEQLVDNKYILQHLIIYHPEMPYIAVLTPTRYEAGIEFFNFKIEPLVAPN